MTGRDSLLNYMDEQRAAGKAHRTIQWRFGDKWDGKGNRICVWCGKTLPSGKKKQRWCGQKCVDEFLVIKGDMGQVRGKLRAREKETCQECHTDLKSLEKILHWDLETLSTTISSAKMYAIWSRWHYWFGEKTSKNWDQYCWGNMLYDSLPNLIVQGKHKESLRVEARMLLEGFSRRSLWQADHIVAVEDGGSGTDLSNFQLLCTKCHLAKTNKAKAAKALKRAQERNEVRAQADRAKQIPWLDRAVTPP